MSSSGQVATTSKKSRKNQGGKGGGSDEETPEELTKEEKKIARYLRLSGPKKQGNLMGMKVDFFVGAKLADFLMESKWGPGLDGSRAGKNPLLANRQSCLAFMQRLMNKQLFYRAMKIYRDQVESSTNSGGGEATGTEATPKPSKKKAAKEVAASETPSTGSKQQPKRKFKLDILEQKEQKFLDNNDPYVWFYDPTSTKTYIIGSLLILGAIGICLFPLWPSQVREGVYYVSLAGASFLGAILGLAVLKYVLFAIVWAVTVGSVHFWLFPNLTEDVGFYESFVPVYKCNCSSSKSKSAVVSSEEASHKKDDDQNKPSDEKDASESSSSSLVKKASSNDLSKSTVEINNLDNGEESDGVRRRRSSANREEEDGFELVDDEDLNK